VMLYEALGDDEAVERCNSPYPLSVGFKHVYSSISERVQTRWYETHVGEGRSEERDEIITDCEGDSTREGLCNVEREPSQVVSTGSEGYILNVPGPLNLQMSSPHFPNPVCHCSETRSASTRREGGGTHIQERPQADERHQASCPRLPSRSP
jgi:hypothetical protein